MFNQKRNNKAGVCFDVDSYHIINHFRIFISAVKKVYNIIVDTIMPQTTEKAI